MKGEWVCLYRAVGKHGRTLDFILPQRWNKPVANTADNLPPLSEAQRQKQERLENMRDDQIDTTDQPELTAAQLAEMQPGMFRPNKAQIIARIDVDVLAWLKSGGAGLPDLSGRAASRVV